jgi:erythronate-4-phosphate dehydrogenase
MVDLGTPHIAGYSLDGKIAGMIMIYKALCEYFSLEPEYDIEDFLPEPDVSELHIEGQGDEQNALLSAVRGIYDIGRDDRNLRRVSVQPVDARGRYFDELRKNYPIRREFQNTRVVVKGSRDLAGKLAGIGFLPLPSQG